MLHCKAYTEDTLKEFVSENHSFECLTMACLSGVNKSVLPPLIESPDNFMVAGFIVHKPSVNIFIDDFNSLFTHFKLETVKRWTRLQFLNNMAKCGNRRDKPNYEIDEFPLSVMLFRLTSDHNIDARLLFAISIPILQMVRGFGDRYSTYSSYCLHPTLEEVLEAGRSHRNNYGIWSSEPCTLEKFMMLDDPKIIEELSHHVEYLCGTDDYPNNPRGTDLVRLLNTILRGDEK